MMKGEAAAAAAAALAFAFFCTATDAFAPSIVRSRDALARHPPPATAMCAMSSSTEHYSVDGVTRREIITCALACLVHPSIANADNLPSKTGADLSRTGSIDTLVPIVAMQRAVSASKGKLADSNEGSLPETCTIVLQSLLKDIPREEKAFKRIFDEYSTPVSYKQSTKFLVYYTKGFDGPGRPGIEEDVNSIQTLQYGARNDAWAAMDELFVELEFGQKGDSTSASKGELIGLIDKVLTPLDSYLSLAPVADVKDERRQLEKR